MFSFHYNSQQQVLRLRQAIDVKLTKTPGDCHHWAEAWAIESVRIATLAYLGIAFGFGIPMAYAAHLDAIPRVAWYLLLANVFWAIAYDTEYAMFDREDDLKIGIKTSAITFGRFDVAAVMLCYALTLGLLVWVGSVLHLGRYYHIGLGVAGVLAAYHFLLIRQRDPARCFKAFMHNNWLGASIFAGIVLDYLLR